MVNVPKKKKKIFNELVKILLREHKVDTLHFFILFIVSNIIEVICFSYLISQIITGLKKGNSKVNSVIKLFLVLTPISLIFNYLKRMAEYKLISIFQQRSRIKLIEILYRSNTHYYINKNYNNYVTPINRLSGAMGNLIRDTLTTVLPYFVFIAIITCLLYYKFDFKVGTFFLLANLTSLSIIYYSLPSMTRSNEPFEKNAVRIEQNLIESCNNMDKIVFRGMTTNKYKSLENNAIVTEETQIQFNKNIVKITSIAKLIQDVIILPAVIFWLVYKKYTIANVILAMTMLSLYKSRGDSFFVLCNMIVETIGRKKTVEHLFTAFLDNYYKSLDSDLSKKDISSFNQIHFDDLSFSYGSKKVLNKVNLKLDFNDTKIVGFYGASGYGKSTLMKLLIKLYKPEGGQILINQNDISKIDSEYLKKRIIYVNQEQRLFDTDIEHNLTYGCDNCGKELNQLVDYENIFRTFPKKDFLKYKTGFSGNNLSGGQRQIINVLNGLITPSDILILDEPTSSIDGDTKKLLIELILKYKDRKKGIIIVTHDISLINSMDRVIKMEEYNNI